MKEKVSVTKNEIYLHICDYCDYAPIMCACEPDICAYRLSQNPSLLRNRVKRRLKEKQEKQDNT